MKYTIAAVALLGAANAYTTAPPIQDSFVFVNDEKMHVTDDDTELVQTDSKVRNGDGTLAIVPVRRVNPL